MDNNQQPNDNQVSLLRGMRHLFYNWLDEQGLPEMGIGRRNRGEVCDFLENYARAKNEVLYAELQKAQRKNEAHNIEQKQEVDNRLTISKSTAYKKSVNQPKA
jgi:hypothetical protein